MSERRRSQALGKLGEKAATNEVITKLVSALENEREWVREMACATLEKMGEKAATNEVVSKLVSLVDSTDRRTYGCVEALGSILSSFAVMKQLNPEIILKLCLSDRASDCLRNISENDLIDMFFETNNPDWLFAIPRLAFQRRSAVIDTEEKVVVVFGKKEPVELRDLSSQLRHQLVEAFMNQGIRLHVNLEWSS